MLAIFHGDIEFPRCPSFPFPAQPVRHGIPFVESNSGCDNIRELYKDFAIFSITAKRSIGARSSSRKNVGEVLIMP